MEIPRRASADRILEAVEELRKRNLRDVSIDEVKGLLEIIITGHRIISLTIRPGQTVFRARRGPKRTDIRDLLYPVSNVRMNRANRDGNPILYTSEIREIPLFELPLDVGDTLTLANWTTTSPLPVNRVGYSAETFTRLGSSREAGWGDGPAPLTGDPTDKLVDDFLAECFTRSVLPGEEDRYKLSVAVAEWLFTADVFDGLIYPSIAMWGNAANIAIKPRFADGSLVFVSAQFLEVASVRHKSIDVRVLDEAQALLPDGSLQWEDQTVRWKITRPAAVIRCTVEEGKWVARDELGNIVDPSAF
jgi:hypothetical protein